MLKVYRLTCHCLLRALRATVPDRLFNQLSLNWCQNDHRLRHEHSRRAFALRFRLLYAPCAGLCPTSRVSGQSGDGRCSRQEIGQKKQTRSPSLRVRKVLKPRGPAKGGYAVADAVGFAYENACTGCGYTGKAHSLRPCWRYGLGAYDLAGAAGSELSATREGTNRSPVLPALTSS